MQSGAVSAPGLDAPEARGRKPEGPAVRALGVSRRYGFQWALRAVQFVVPQGACVALLGANGSGKTTLLKILASVLRPTRGTVEVLGSNVAKSPDSVRARVGLLAHATYLYEELTALENLKFAAAMYGLPTSQRLGAVEQALRSVGLEPLAEARVRTFSSGMKKRLALARATLHKPDLILLDEPYGALDTVGLEWVDGFLRSVRTRGATAIIATHHVARILPLSQQVLWLVEGRLAYDGAPEGFTAATTAAGMAWEER